MKRADFDLKKEEGKVFSLLVRAKKRRYRMADQLTKVLIVEDKIEEVELVKHHLECTDKDYYRFKVEAAASLEAVLIYLREFTPDVILLDLNLTDSRGFDTFEAIHKQVPSIPIVILTCMNDESMACEAVSRGAQDYLVKPQVNPGVISRVLRYAVERKRFQDRLREAQKMEAVGRLASGVTHDLRNFVTAIMGYAELLLRSIPADETLKHHVEEIIKAGERANDLIRQLLTFCRRSAANAKIYDLRTILETMRALLGRILGEDIEIRSLCPPEECLVRVDSNQIEQVIMNLAANARSAMKEGGVFELKVEKVNVMDDKNVRGLTMKAGRYVLLSVRDTGAGMDRSIQDRIFEPFFTMNSGTEGTGLGLSIAHEIITENGGFILVSSETGAGTVFEIYFPNVSGKVTEAAGQAARMQEVPMDKFKGTETVLVVEDDMAIRSLVRTVLTRNGYTVLEASHGKEAVEIAERYESEIQIMLTDSVMPEMSSGELIQLFKTLRPQIKVLVMSGYSLQKDGDVKNRKDTDFLQKPFTAIVLLSKMRQLLETH